MKPLIGLLLLLLIGFGLTACAEEQSLVDLQAKHCAAAANWFGRADGVVTVTDTKTWNRAGNREVSVTYDLKSRPDSDLRGATIRNMIKCTYLVQGSRKETLKAIAMEIGGRKLSDETREAMNVRIGLLGQGSQEQ